MKTTSLRLHCAAEPTWSEIHEHPFVRGLGDGSLPVDAFRWFLLQDYLYLFEYARVFAYGVIKSPKEELMCFFAENVDAILHGEMNLHRAYMKRMGIAEEEVLHVRPSHANVSYTHYMLAIAAAGGPEQILAAILACSWSYAEIAERLAKIPHASAHPLYGEWIQGYTSKDYTTTNARLINQLDELTTLFSEEQLQRLEDIFVRCSRFELDFWDMAWNRDC